MMAIVAISLPEFVILRRVIRPQLIAIFAAVVVTGILVVGLLFNALGSRKETPMRTIEVLGPGCANCLRLELVAAEAVSSASASRRRSARSPITARSWPTG